MDFIDAIYWNGWAQIALVAVALAAFAGIADWLRSRRRNIDAVGFMPWTGIMVLSFAFALFAAALAIVQG